jgi:hypothetical protein
MNTSLPPLSWWRSFRGFAVVFTLAAVTLLVSVGWNHLQWRSRWIEWDKVSIQRNFGGEAHEDRIQQIEFLKEWEYRALKRTGDGKDVWLHLALSKRHCGNWGLVNPDQRDLVRPLEVRYPDGLPRREGAANCFGAPLD